MSRWCEKKNIYIYIYTYNKSWHCGCVISSGSDSLLRGGRGALSRAILSHTALSHTQRCDTQTRTQTHTTLPHHSFVRHTHTHTHTCRHIPSIVTHRHTQHCHTRTRTQLNHTRLMSYIPSLSLSYILYRSIFRPFLPLSCLSHLFGSCWKKLTIQSLKKNAILCITCIVVCMFLPKCRGASITCIASYMTISFK